MKIYLATPVNARKEKTLQEKMNGALKRIQEMAKYLKKNFDPEFEPSCSFDILEVWSYYLGRCKYQPSESLVMGKCVRMVMECDMIVLDDGWESSQGCTVERFVAMQYGKQVKTINSFKLNEVLKGIYKLAEEQMQKEKKSCDTCLYGTRVEDNRLCCSYAGICHTPKGEKTAWRPKKGE